MIEWIITGLALLAFGSKDRSGSGLKPAGLTSGNRTSGDDQQSKTAEWRAQWDATVDRTRWIPLSTASWIVAKFPPPNRPHWYHLLRGKPPDEEKLLAEFAAHNADYLAKQKERLKPFFGRVEKNPLTEEQVEACICMDDAVQIVAAAGSGKTSTMVAKAGYALHEGFAKPEQILLLAFNDDAAKELRQRIDDRLAGFEGIERITAKTFHAFGLQVIGKATGKKPSLAPWMEEPGQDVRQIVTIIEDLRQRDSDFRRDWDLFRTVYGRDIGPWSTREPPNTFRNGRYGIETVNGEVVKSQEEAHIADWLFYHGVSYEYERRYEHDTATERYRQYKPDFFYPDINLYHEHFALNREGKPPKHFDGDYLAGVHWKRQLHADMGTELFETTSHEIRSDAGFTRLAEELTRRGIKLHLDPDREPKGQRPVSNEELASTIRTFQQHVKGNGLSYEQLRSAVSTSSTDGHAARLTRFLDLFARISDEWERRLREVDCIDFDDMLLAAAEHIESSRFESPYTMILADEFQDSSRTRVRLLKALLKNAGEHAHLCVVGDDWQGINRFAGADISVMTEFDKTFEHSTRLMLNTTFRCPQALCDASSAFIQANPQQIRKTVQTTNSYENPSLVAYAFEHQGDAMAHLEKQLARMHHLIRSGKLAPDGGQIKVLLLGRYRDDRPADLRRWQKKFGGHLNLEFRTVHSSKGLEAEYVFLLNMVEGIRGFPSQIMDDPVLQLAMPAPDPFPTAEERRLFYVALTRAKRQVRIYTSTTKPSRFLTELVENGTLAIKTVDGQTLTPCPKCGVGMLKRQTSKYGPFETCSTWPGCDFKRNIKVDSVIECSPRPQNEAPVPESS